MTVSGFWHNAALDPSSFKIDKAPEGVVTAIFIQGLWDTEHNFISCFVTDNLLQKRFCLQTFARFEYRPCESGPPMFKAKAGERYQLNIGKFRQGKSVFSQARLVDNNI